MSQKCFFRNGEVGYDYLMKANSDELNDTFQTMDW